jgi:hypothetical protein
VLLQLLLLMRDCLLQQRTLLSHLLRQLRNLLQLVSGAAVRCGCRRTCTTSRNSCWRRHDWWWCHTQLQLLPRERCRCGECPLTLR